MTDPRSLPMRPAWRRVAERADKRAFTPEEISQALTPAMEQDCRDDMSPEFLSGIRRVVEEPSLFKDDVAARLEALRPQAGAGIGRAVLDNVRLLSAAEADGFAVVQEAVKAALGIARTAAPGKWRSTTCAGPPRRAPITSAAGWMTASAAPTLAASPRGS